MRLTKRDSDIIAYLSEQGVATSEQLAIRFFNKSRNAFFVRSAKLVQERFLESVNIYQHRHLLRSRFRDLLQAFERSPGNSNLKLYRLGSRFKIGEKEFELSTPIFWQHQVSLNEVRSIVEKLLPKEALILSDPEIKSEWARFRLGSEVPIPDLEIRYLGVSMALEFERTKKTELRYFERFAAYSRSHYSLVLYITENGSIERLLKAASRRFPKIRITDLSNLGKQFSQFNGFEKIGELATNERSR